MSTLLYAGGIILAVVFLVAVAGALLLVYKKKYLAGGSVLAAVLVLLSAGAYAAGQFKASTEKSMQDQMRSYDENTSKEADEHYQEALVLLGAVSLQNPDQHTLEAAQRDLESLGDSHLGAGAEERYPDLPVLMAYTRLLLAVSSHEEGLTDQAAARDKKMAEALGQIPEGYQGKLAEKIMPVRQVLLAKKTAGEKQAERDAKDLARHQENLKQGQYGLIAQGDPESKLLAALGEPAYVNDGVGEDGMRQYVFHHHSRNIYVYTKNGIVTEVRGL